jgi:hypothetical protein
MDIWPVLTRQLEEDINVIWSLNGNEPQRAMFSKVALGGGLSSFIYPCLVIGRWNYEKWWSGATVVDPFKSQFWNFLPILSQSCIDNADFFKKMPKQWGEGLSKEAAEKFNKLRFVGSEKTIKQVLIKILYIKDKAGHQPSQNHWLNIYQEDGHEEPLRMASICLSLRSMIEWAVVEKIISHKLVAVFAEKVIVRIGGENVYTGKKLASFIEKTKNGLMQLKENTEAMELMGSILSHKKVTKKSI